MDVRRGFRAAGNVEVAATRRAGADKDRVPAFGEQGLETVDAHAGAEVDPEVEDIVALLVDHALRQAEARDLGADHAARLGVGIENGALVPERRQVAGNGQRSGPGPDEGDALAVLLRSRSRQARFDVALVVGGDALQPADCDRLVLDPAAPAGGLARPVTGAPEHAR